MSESKDFVIEGGVLRLYKGPGGDVVIPEGVTAIGDNAFEDTAVRAVGIPEGVTKIGINAFGRCAELEKVIFPGNLKEIKAYAFFECRALKEIDLPESLEVIGEFAFAGCAPTSVSIPGKVRRVGKGSFLGCGSLRSVTIRDGVRYLDSKAFSYCPLKTVKIPGSVTMIRVTTFSGCPLSIAIHAPVGSAAHAFAIRRGLDFVRVFEKQASGRQEFVIKKGVLEAYIGDGGKVVIPDGVTEIGDAAFLSCDGVTGVVIPSGVEKIGQDVFHSCENLAAVVIPEGVTEIGDRAFSDCSALSSIEFPASVRSLGDDLFEMCDGLASIKVKKGNPVFHSTGNCIIETASRTLIFGCKTSVIPDDGSVTEICGEAFCSARELFSITIPETVERVGSWAFAYCDRLMAVTVLGKETDFEEEAFYSSSGVVIRAFAGSCAEVYAIKNKIPFKAI